MVFALRPGQVGKSDNDKWSNATILLKVPFSFVIIYYEAICFFHQVGVEVSIVLQISPQMFNVTHLTGSLKYSE